MTTLQPQTNFPFLVELKINKNIKQKYFFKTEAKAYKFFLTNLKKEIESVSTAKVNYFSAFLYDLSLGRKRLLVKKNLTRIIL